VLESADDYANKPGKDFNAFMEGLVEKVFQHAPPPTPADKAHLQILLYGTAVCFLRDGPCYQVVEHAPGHIRRVLGYGWLN
jgi:hypothetical protein